MGRIKIHARHGSWHGFAWRISRRLLDLPDGFRAPPSTPEPKETYGITVDMLVPMLSGRSLLLDLPPELRNLVYREVLNHHSPMLNPGSKVLVSTSALSGVHPQVQKEFASMYLAAPLLVAQVRNLDFRHIVTFLNSLKEKELAATHSDNALKSPERSLKIELTFSHYLYYRSEYLPRWLRRLDNPKKKGTNFDVEYTVHEDDRIECIDKRLVAHFEWEKRSVTGQRAKADLAKVVEALSAAEVVWSQ